MLSCTEFTYVPAAGKYYKAITTVSDWYTAVKSCQQFGPFSHLVALETSGETAAVNSYMSATYDAHAPYFLCAATSETPTDLDRAAHFYF